MAVKTKSALQLAQKAYEYAWLAERSRYEADREFGRMRRKAMLRMAAGILAGRQPGSDEPKEESRTRDGSHVPIDSIVGIVDRHGRKVPRLPVLNRKLQAEWRRVFSLDSDETFPDLTVSGGRGGWYLAGGAAALIALEVQRAKKRGTVHVVPAPEPETRQCCGATEKHDGDECCDEMPGIAS
jgi:hypothetical protein